jgi:hypothetical protein
MNKLSALVAWTPARILCPRRADRRLDASTENAESLASPLVATRRRPPVLRIASAPLAPAHQQCRLGASSARRTM